jgi:16S rRNA (cytosine967-C5)-methyltransferase
MVKVVNPAREQAFLALNTAFLGKGYVSDVLNRDLLTSQDLRFTEELAYGVMQRQYTLEYYAKQIIDKGKSLKLKRKEKILLFMALYQALYMDRVPSHAWTNETIELAKKYCSKHIIAFLTYLLRKIPHIEFSLPKDDSIEALSISYSYPEAFIRSILNELCIEDVKTILKIGNQAAPIFVRVFEPSEYPTSCEQVPPFFIAKTKNLDVAFSSQTVYVQNITPLKLLSQMHQESFHPNHILDLCASPGGKTLALAKLYPHAQLYSNDVSQKKIDRLKSNMEKYQVSTHFSMHRGELFPFSKQYDLIVADLPCSNSGVFNKRPEARWRYTTQSMEELFALQMKILENAVQGIKKNGELWVMTCSFLDCENERLIESLCSKYPLRVRVKKKILPSDYGEDGGFACALQHL